MRAITLGSCTGKGIPVLNLNYSCKKSGLQQSRSEYKDITTQGHIWQAVFPLFIKQVKKSALKGPIEMAGKALQESFEQFWTPPEGTRCCRLGKR